MNVIDLGSHMQKDGKTEKERAQYQHKSLEHWNNVDTTRTGVYGGHHNGGNPHPIASDTYVICCI